ncbi:MAG: alpha/beta hydrolase [Planctomycetes bacterium]|nr:alpha/beta hydrolase [Planctomycetota bacterium]
MTSRRPSILARAGVTAAAAVAAVAALCSCSSLSKTEVETRLLALPKNERVRDVGIERRSMTIRIDGADVAAEVTVFRAPSQSPDAARRRPVLLVHGTPGSLFTWTDVVFGKTGAGGVAERGLAADFDVYAIDVVGHGTTRTEAPPVTFQKCADWVAGAIRGLGIGPVHLVGNSYGGEFCWRAAVDHPELVQSLTLLDSSGWKRPDDGWLPEEVAMREMSLAPIGYLFSSAEKVRGALQPHFPYPVTDDQVAECDALCRNGDGWKAMVSLARDENGTREHEIAAITRPTLLLWGADDIAFPVERDAKRFAASIVGSVLHVLPKCGHYPQETLPGDVAALLRGHFLAHP